jgi:hypothetical protein
MIFAQEEKIVYILRNNLGATLPNLPPLTGHPWDTNNKTS